MVIGAFVVVALSIFMLGDGMGAAATDSAPKVAVAATSVQGGPCGGGEIDASPETVLARQPPATSEPTSEGTAVLRATADLPLPGGASRFDYQSFDETTGRLYIAHMGAGQVLIVDTASQRVVGTVDDVPSVTGVLVVPELGLVFAAVAGDHLVAVIDGSSLKVIARVGQIGFPDGLDYAPGVRQVFVSDESGGGELVLDAKTMKAVTTIDLGGEAGNTRYDPVSGCVFVAVQTRNQLVAIDPTTDAVVGRYALGSTCQGPHGFLIDALRRVAFVACEGNATLVVVDLRTMDVTAIHPVGDGPDVLAFDPGWRRLYVASEAGIVSVFDERGVNLEPVGEYAAPHAHSVAVDPRTHRVYLPLENVAGKPVLRVMTAAAPEGER